MTLSCRQDTYYEREKSGKLVYVTLRSQQQTRWREEKAIVGGTGVRKIGTFISKPPRGKTMAHITEKGGAASGLIWRWGMAEGASWGPWRTQLMATVPRERRDHGPSYSEVLTLGRRLTKNQAKYLTAYFSLCPRWSQRLYRIQSSSGDLGASA